MFSDIQWNVSINVFHMIEVILENGVRQQQDDETTCGHPVGSGASAGAWNRDCDWLTDWLWY